MRDWLGFLLALLLATALWFTLRERAPVVERALSVPLQVVGLGADRVVQGVPKEVSLVLQGPAPLVTGANPPVSAFLDLSGVEGPFSREVQVAAPQGVSLKEVRPARVEGRVEAILERQIPVEVLAQGAWVETTPAFVQARGPKSLVEEAVVALGLDLGSEVVLTPFGPMGPLLGVELRPATVRVTARREALFRKVVPLEYQAPRGFRVLRANPLRVEVVGPKEALEGIQRVLAQPEGGFRVGVVEGPLRLDLPPGVGVLGEVWARLEVGLQ